MVLYYQFSLALTERQCAIAYQFSAWMFVVGMTIAELLLTIRTWAVWEKDVRLGIILFICYGGFSAVEVITLALYLRKLTHAPSPFRPLVPCVIGHVNRMLSVCWILLMAYDAVIFALIVVQAIKTFRFYGNVPLMRVIYQDGIIYFAYLFGLSLLNVVIILVLPAKYVNLISLTERIAHALLTCRVILHIKEIGARDKHPPEIEAVMEATV
ncbi:hypothetical protein NP233_g255 [Leucocoprinus birnbaumii]|uniref:Uncharacterized protein n=1 Tax=Leucocoprinus birnbaumii TaxID=56174 RepID=A0AAD5YWV2_9AGAR|nr:hypothetical protein NP233_g255 [Leucocoprinus birnbaumii]